MSAVSGFREGLHTWLLGGYRRYLQARRILNRCKNPLRVLVYGFLLVYVVWFLLSLYYTRTHVYHILHEGREFKLNIQLKRYTAFRLNYRPGYLMHKQYTEICLVEKEQYGYAIFEKNGEYIFAIDNNNPMFHNGFVVDTDNTNYMDFNSRGKPSVWFDVENGQLDLYAFINLEQNTLKKTTLPIDHPAFASIKVDEDYNEWNKTSTYPKNKYWRPSTTFLNFYNPTPKEHPLGSRYPKQTFLGLLKKLDEGKALFEDDFHQFDALANQLIEEDFRSIGGLKPVEKTDSKK
jgi:hypothetical protein